MGLALVTGRTARFHAATPLRTIGYNYRAKVWEVLTNFLPVGKSIEIGSPNFLPAGNSPGSPPTLAANLLAYSMEGSLGVKSRSGRRCRVSGTGSAGILPHLTRNLVRHGGVATQVTVMARVDMPKS